MSTPQPTVPLASLVVSVSAALTTAAIDIGASTTTVKLARAQTAAQIAAVLTAAGSGNVSEATGQLGTLIDGIADPGLQAVASDLAGIAQPFIAIDATIVANAPSVASALSSVGAGMAQVAGAYISKYGTAAK